MEVTGTSDIGEQEVECPLCRGTGEWTHIPGDSPHPTEWAKDCPCCFGHGTVTVTVGEVEVTLDVEPSEMVNEGYH